MCRQAAVHPALRCILSCHQPFVFCCIIPRDASLFVGDRMRKRWTRSSTSTRSCVVGCAQINISGRWTCDGWLLFLTGTAFHQTREGGLGQSRTAHFAIRAVESSRGFAVTRQGDARRRPRLRPQQPPRRQRHRRRQPLQPRPPFGPRQRAVGRHSTLLTGSASNRSWRGRWA